MMAKQVGLVTVLRVSGVVGLNPALRHRLPD